MRSRLLVAFTLAMMAFASISSAQGIQTGTLRGTVTTPDKAALAGASVTIKSPALQADRSTVTAQDGSFVFVGLPPGTYTVTVKKDTMQPLEQKFEVPLGGVA